MSIAIDKEFIDKVGSRLHRFRWTGNHAVCKCPLNQCETNERDIRNSKTRGGFIKSRDGDSYLYTCRHCGRSLSLYHFMKTVAEDLATEYNLSKFNAVKNRRGSFRKAPAITSNDLPQGLLVNSLSKDAIALTKLRSDHYAVEYATKRGIPKEFFAELLHAPDFAKYVKDKTGKDLYLIEPGEKPRPPEARLIIPCLDENGNMTAFQGRSYIKNATLRYITISLNPNVTRVWGRNRIDKTKPIYVTEGPLKSMQLDNSIAMCGADSNSIPALYPDSELIYVFDNEDNNALIMKRILGLIKSGAKVVIWTDCPFESKDIDDAINIEGFSKEEVMEYLRSHTFSGLRAELEFTKWNRSVA